MLAMKYSVTNCRQKYIQSENPHQCCITRVNLTPLDKEYASQTKIDWEEYYEKKMCETKWKHVFFDIETDIVDDGHEPILLIMQREDGTETVFYGKDCVDEFCEEVFSFQI